MLDVKFAYSSNGESFVEFDFLTGQEKNISMEKFPAPEELMERLIREGRLTAAERQVIAQPFYISQNTYAPRYERLANGIIEQAVKDYRRARKYLKKHPRTEELEAAVAAQLVEKKKRREEWVKLNLPRAREKRSKEERLLDNIHSNERMAVDTGKFFLSDWFTDLTEINGKWLLERLKQEVG